jgi:hypothetical protein
MKKVGLLLFLAMPMTLLLGGTARAQGDNSVYFVTYYSNANTDAPIGVLRIINDGDNSTSQTEGKPNGNLWASIYVFDDSQELQECCSCFVSADGLLSESVNGNLTSNELTGYRAENFRGVIKVISSSNGDPTNNVKKAGLRGTMTHIQEYLVNENVTYVTTEVPLADSNLVSAEQTALQQSCSFAITLGSGQGTCFCTPEDSDF